MRLDLELLSVSLLIIITVIVRAEPVGDLDPAADSAITTKWSKAIKSCDPNNLIDSIQRDGLNPKATFSLGSLHCLSDGDSLLIPILCDEPEGDIIAESIIAIACYKISARKIYCLNSRLDMLLKSRIEGVIGYDSQRCGIIISSEKSNKGERDCVLLVWDTNKQIIERSLKWIRVAEPLSAVNFGKWKLILSESKFSNSLFSASLAGIESHCKTLIESSHSPSLMLWAAEPPSAFQGEGGYWVRRGDRNDRFLQFRCDDRVPVSCLDATTKTCDIWSIPKQKLEDFSGDKIKNVYPAGVDYGLAKFSVLIASIDDDSLVGFLISNSDGSILAKWDCDENWDGRRSFLLSPTGDSAIIWRVNDMSIYNLSRFDIGNHKYSATLLDDDFKYLTLGMLKSNLNSIAYGSNRVVEFDSKWNMLDLIILNKSNDAF